jgi:hypothetical protein
MNTIKKLMLGILLISWTAAVASAQEHTDTGPAAPASTVTISASGKGVRYAAFGNVRQVRLEVFGANGESLYNSGFQPGSVRDWALDDGRGQRLSDGTYLCVVTVRELSGGMSVKQGSVVLQGGQVSLQLSEAERAGTAEFDKSFTQTTNGVAAAATLTAHDGNDGQVVSTRGGLSFRSGDFFSGRDKELMRLTPSGNLGLGVTEPKAKLDVAGTIHASGGIQFDDGTLLTSSASPFRVGSANTPEPLVGGSGTTNRVTKWVDAGGTLGDSSLTDTGGRLGVNRTNPSTALDVQGVITLRNSATSGGFKVGDRVTNEGRQIVFGAAPGSPYSVLNTFVQGSTLASPAVAQFATWTSDIDADAANATQFFFRHDPSLGGVIATQTFGSATAKRISFQANWNGSNTPNALVIDTTGNVGVGTVSPQSRLEVAGDIKVTGNAVVVGNIAAKYQDVAEWVSARMLIAAGTVVSLDSARANGVVPSARAYDTRVAGVVSAQPGMILGEGGEGMVPVATMGRVKVRVDATRRPIRIGDLLVTSDRPGVAMRSLPRRAGRVLIHRPGTIIGKALEPLADGEGEILVLLSLQ